MNSLKDETKRLSFLQEKKMYMANLQKLLLKTKRYLGNADARRDNVRNQWEHLVCLLADNHIRLTPRPEFLNKLDDRAVDAVKTKFFKNYKNWCKFLGRILDIILNFPGFHRWKFTEILRNILKIALSLAWCVVLPLCDAQSNSSAPGMLKQWISFLPRDVKGVPPLHILAVALCLLPNVLTAIMFIFPMLRRWIENSVWHIIRLHVWWSQTKLANKSTVVHQSQHRERQRIGGNDGCSGLGGISNYSPNWWRNWSSTALARRKGTCDDVQLGSWKREGIQSRRMKKKCFMDLTPQIIPSSETEASAGCGVALCFLQIFVEAANAFLRRSKAKRSVMSSDTVFSFFYREVVDAQKEVSRQGKD
ncbi:hypothetical protein HID58_071009 [Brassica napus]|uniref:1,3-beta-glucan synthase subunit FKS1-like domain-containing protein n=1 Tax=Brassica napus TaxID=3708 RepID=A0ABQ7Z0C2_BRANA|nr:hypothetical protein HID58_071009 [Brassica napus]